MGVSRHEHVLVPLALRDECVEKLFHGLAYALQLVACEQFQVHKHLVVARTSAVYLLSRVAQRAGKHQFHLGVYVFDALLDDKVAFLYCAVYVAQLIVEALHLIGGKHAYALEHGAVGKRPQHVVTRQQQVELSVPTYREAFDFRVNLGVLLPKFLCHLFSTVSLIAPRQSSRCHPSKVSRPLRGT